MRLKTNGIITPGRSRGFTLIEVMVTLLILTIGLLGVAAMQVQGLKFNHDSYLRTQISNLATDIADRMRMNSTNAANYVGNYTAPQANACNVAAAAGAVNDLACWRETVDEVLPGGTQANIVASATIATGYDINIVWTDRENETRTISYTLIP
ncbi:MAG: type IV pilus modification protein PilV [Gammaproteobacteria bacterium]|nr:MAG: type IV pilus modification protein PilV [Gammaproteobacteria bacterium]